MRTDEQYIPGHLYMINLSDLLPDSEQPRKYMEPAALTELVESIRQHGVLQPVLFRKDSGGLLYVVAGERRCAAARMASLTAIPAIYRESDNYDEISLIENILRSDLTAVEEAEALDRLMKKHNYSQDDLAKKVSKTKSSISRTLSLTRLPKEVLDECRKDPAMPKRVLVEIAQKKQERSMLSAYLKYKASLNPQKKTPTGGKPTAAQNTFNAMDAMERKIDNLDFQALLPEDRESFVIALENLKQTIQNKLDTASKPSKNLA
jgi:ParB family chromosome partitioning protein